MLQYPWEPHNTLRSDTFIYRQLFGNGVPNLDNIDEQIKSALAYMIDYNLEYQINDTIHLSIQNALRHISTLSRETRALARDRIPSSAQQNDQTLQFLIAFMYEKEIAFDDFVEFIKGKLIYDNRTRGYYISRAGNKLYEFIDNCSENASEVVEVLAIARSKIGNFAEKSEFIRDWALINLGKKTGLEITANGNPFEVGLDGDNREYSELLANPNTPNTCLLYTSPSPRD